MLLVIGIILIHIAIIHFGSLILTRKVVSITVVNFPSSKMVIFSHCKDKNMNHTLDDKQNKFYPVPHPEVGLNSQKLFLLSI